VNSLEAKKILSAHRPGRDGANEPDLAEALEQARRDPALQEWWKQQQKFHGAMKHGFAEIPVPDKLRDQILARSKLVPLPAWHRPTIWAAAAGIILLLGLAGFWLRPSPTNGSFATFRSRMVRAVLTQYRMDIETNDMASIRQFLATNNAPADYVISPLLAKLPPTGAGILSWQRSRVAMVCLDSQTQGTWFLFIANRSEVTHPPTAAREFAQVNKLMTVSWTQGEKVYVLAGSGGREMFERYF